MTRDEVRIKYAPIPFTDWTPEVEAAFFANLPKATRRVSEEKAMLIREFATDALDAKRMSGNYIETLGAILGNFAEADAGGTECLVSRRDESLGTERTIRTIQGQMQASGHLVKQTRSQGHGFVGAVYVYAPVAQYRNRIGAADFLERAHRSKEGERPYPALPSNLNDSDIPY